MIYTLFFSRMRDIGPDGQADYAERAAAMRDLAVDEYPAFVDIKTYVADDGERLTVARFEDDESQRAWASDPRHVEVQKRGRDLYYERYRLVVCEPKREREWSRPEAAVDQEEG